MLYYDCAKNTWQRGFVMNREEILEISKRENEGKPDERELVAQGQASRIGMSVGALICVLLVLVSRFVFNMPELAFAGFMVYFAMQGISNIVLFQHLKNRSKLIYGIVEIVFAVLFAISIAFKVGS